MKQTDLSSYIHSAPHRKYSALKRLLWFYVNALLFKTGLFPSSQLKVSLLRIFGAKIGNKVVIRTGVNIKHPWLLRIGDHSWIGENVWIDNLVMVSIGSNVCISQGATLLTGSHNYKDPSFGLLTGVITLEDGVWIGAQTTVNPGLTAASHAVLTAGSVATKNLEARFIYQGNPASKTRPRIIS
jgi:putative colanic acid biosynthesis acetyltransferase WcaF